MLFLAQAFVSSRVWPQQCGGRTGAVQVHSFTYTVDLVHKLSYSNLLAADFTLKCGFRSFEVTLERMMYMAFIYSLNLELTKLITAILSGANIKMDFFHL